MARSHRKDRVVSDKQIYRIYYYAFLKGLWIGMYVSSIIWTIVGLLMII